MKLQEVMRNRVVDYRDSVGVCVRHKLLRSAGVPPW